MADLNLIAENLIEGKADKIRKLTQRAIDEGLLVKEILNDGLIRG